MRQRCIKEGRASWAQGGVCRGGNAKLQPQQPRIVTQKGLAVPPLGVQSHQNWHAGTCQVPCRRYCKMGKDEVDGQQKGRIHGDDARPVEKKK